MAADDYRRLQVKKTCDTQHYCDWCDMTYHRTGTYPKCCPGMSRYIARSVRRTLKRELQREVREN